MPGLTWTDLLPDYVASLSDAASVFTAADQADFKRHLRVASAALSREKRPRTMLGELSLVAEQAEYAAPDDLVMPKVALWPSSYVAPWNLPPGPLPVLSLAETSDGRVLRLQPAPTAAQITAFGSSYRFYYCAQHAITDDAATSTLQEQHLTLLFLRAQAEAMRELSFRGYKKPVTLRAGAGVGGSIQSKNQTPPALWDLLMQEYRATT